MSSLKQALGDIGWLSANANLAVLSLEGIQFKDLRFPNEESYRGGWKDSKPEGEGCYTWADGSTYEGAWHAGLKHGWGTYTWPNGARYQGEWRDGFMQGYGSFESPDGARYAGGWLANLKHGIGRKGYANGDAYDGLWRGGKAEGPGRYVWHNGNQYDGEWRGGKMHGQGTLKWSTGERYDGEWSEGQEDGIGVFTWQDGSTYEGFWQGGKKRGVGVFRPAPNAAAPVGPSSEDSARPRPAPAASGGAAAGGAPPPRSPLAAQLAAADAPLDSPPASALHRRNRKLSPARVADAATAARAAAAAAAELVFVCQYEAGRLLHEAALSTADLELVFGPAKQAVDRRRLRRGRSKRQVRLGETIYKGHRSYDLMLNLQLGIRYTITTLNKLPAPRQLSEAHYAEKVWLRFPREGSEVTPPHPSNDFKWKDYCTTAFKRLRDLFGVDHSAYILSICGDQALREMASPGKSGSVFFISHDDQYMIKTMHKEEIKLLLGMLPKYVRHADANPDTLLTRFYGVHRVKPSHGRKVRFVVMNNVFRTELDLHRKFDLKGSTYGRTAGPRAGGGAIRKDLDLDVAFRVEPAMRDRVAAQLAADAAFLEEIRVMDYSLLLGVHRRHLGETSASPLNSDREGPDGYQSAEEGGGQGGEDEGSDDGSGGLSSAAPSGPLPRGASAGALLPAASGGFPSPSRYLPASGLAVAPTSDSEADVTRSMHSVTIEQASPRPESRSPSFLRKSLTWRSFTAGQRRSQPEMAPALRQQPPQAQQPPPSAQITPRVQPSVLPTPRLAATGQAAAAAQQQQPRPEPAGLASSSMGRGPPPPPPPPPDISAALRKAAVAGAAAAAAAAAGEPGANGWAEEQRRWAGEAGDEEAPLPTWRSDAVQLPEQQLLPDGIPVSPTASVEAAAGPARARGGGPALGAILERQGSGGEGGSEGGLSPPWRRNGQQSPRPGADSPAAASQLSSAATTPTAAAAAPRGLPLPGGVPRIALQAAAPRQLQPAGESNDWMHYAASVSGSARSNLSDSEAPHSAQCERQRSATPDSGALPAAALRRHTAPTPPGVGGADAGAPLPAERGAGGAPPAAAPRRGLASAPATARQPGERGAPAGGGAVHRLAQAAGPGPPPGSPPVAAGAAEVASSPERPRSPHRGSPGAPLARTASAPAGALSAAAAVAAAEGGRRGLAQHGRGVSMLVGREASAAALSDAEAAAAAGRLNARLPASRRVTDQLVQDLVELARYRMVGCASPSARHSRVPTTVLAARAARRPSGAATPAAHHRAASQDEGAGTPRAPAPGAAPDEPPPLPPLLGAGVPAVAVAQQAGQAPEEVFLFFGIIDFLQEYNMRKKLEHSIKAVVQDARGVSVVEPRAYAKRFLRFMDRVFPPTGAPQ